MFLLKNPYDRNIFFNVMLYPAEHLKEALFGVMEDMMLYKKAIPTFAVQDSFKRGNQYGNGSRISESVSEYVQWILPE